MMDINEINPRISVIIPLYNKELYIGRAIDSILSQTIQDFEIIIVNDGSTDKSCTVVESYTDKRIKVLSQENMGVSVARNRGVQEARAEIVAFLDADDEWLPIFLETILDLADKFPMAKHYATGYKLIQSNNILIKSYLPEKGCRYIPSYLHERVKAGIRNHFVMMSGVAVSRALYLQIGGFNKNISYGEDLDLYERLSLHTGLAYSPIVCAIYNNNLPDNTRTHVVFRKPLTTERFDNLLLMTAELNNPRLMEIVSEYVMMNYVVTGFINALRGHKKESKDILRKVSGRNYLKMRFAALLLNSLPRFFQRKFRDIHYGL